MRLNILFGGKAGQGPNILTQLVGEALFGAGYHVFYSRDYQSLIRGGHNFNVLTFSDEEVHSNDSEIDVLVALDEKTAEVHRKDLKKGGFLIKAEGQENMYFAGMIFKILCIDFKILEGQLKRLKNFSENLTHAKKGYEIEMRACSVMKPEKKHGAHSFTNGSCGIADGAIKSGLDIYYAYPMTPATPVLFELAPKQNEGNFFVFELENEIAVMNAALGSASTGAKTMIGTSGGGFDLMTEALSMAGMAEIPVVCYNASRPGPSTGIATYTGQGDLQMARYCGHGEFFRLVLAPGDSVECTEITSQAFYFSQKYKLPVIILSDKHLAESFYTCEEAPILTKSDKTTKLIRFNSYEHTENGEASEDPKVISAGFARRARIKKEVEKEAEKFSMYKIFGKKDSKNIVLSYGSTKGAILDSIKDLDFKFIQILYIEPFPEKIKLELEKAKKIILVENSGTGMLADVVREKTGVEIRDKILRDDGRPFLRDELKEELRRRLK